MSKLLDSYHFVKSTDLPTIDADFSPRDAFRVLETHPSGGFVVTRRGKAQCYVKAAELAETLLGEGRSEKADWDAPLEIVLEKISTREPIVPVAPMDVSADEDETELTAQPPTVFRIVDAGGHSGWFLNHEFVRDTQTRRVQWKCDGPAGHTTYDPDHGDCPRCPGRLQVVVTQL